MATPGKSGSKYVHSDQERDNTSHDDAWGVNAVEIVGENSAGTALLRAKVNDDGSFSTSPGPIVVDTNNTTTSALTAGATYTGTATDILSYQQINVQIYGRPGVVAGDGSSAKASFFFELSKDGTNWDTSVPHLIRDPSLVIPIPIINVHKFFRVKYINDGGVAAIAALGLSSSEDTAGTPTTQTVFRLTTYLLPQATKELTRTLDQSISGSDPVGLTRSVLSSKQPDGDFVNERADGSVFTTTSALGADGVYTSAWFDSDGWRSIELVIVTDKPSITDGVEIQFTDAQAKLPQLSALLVGLHSLAKK